MTTARSASEWVESITETDIKSRVAVEWVETITQTHVAARSAVEWIEVIVGGPASGWTVGYLPIG